MMKTSNKRMMLLLITALAIAVGVSSQAAESFFADRVKSIHVSCFGGLPTGYAKCLIRSGKYRSGLSRSERAILMSVGTAILAEPNKQRRAQMKHNMMSGIIRRGRY